MNTMIKQARVQAGLSQKEVALTLHVSAPTVSERESGKKTPTTENLVKMADLFEVSMDYLTGRFDMRSKNLVSSTHGLKWALKKAESTMFYNQIPLLKKKKPPQLIC